MCCMYLCKYRLFVDNRTITLTKSLRCHNLYYTRSIVRAIRGAQSLRQQSFGPSSRIGKTSIEVYSIRADNVGIKHFEHENI